MIVQTEITIEGISIEGSGLLGGGGDGQVDQLSAIERTGSKRKVCLSMGMVRVMRRDVPFSSPNEMFYH